MNCDMKSTILNLSPLSLALVLCPSLVLRGACFSFFDGGIARNH